MNDLNNISLMIKDVISGDPTIDQREDYDVSGEELERALNLILANPKLSDQQKRFYISNSWKIHYRGNNPPPNIKEFLSSKWLGATAESIYPYVKDTLYQFWNPKESYRNLILSPSIGWGKMAPKDSKLFTPHGFIRMGDVQIGDELSTPNGKTAKVIKIFPQGIKDIYEITFKDGRKTHAGAEHLWKVASCLSNKKWINPWQIKTTKEILDSGLYRNTKTPKWKIPLTEPVYHNRKEHYFSPYCIGVLLGDGYIPNKYCSISFTSTDNEIVDKMKKEVPINTRITHSNNSIQYRIIGSPMIKDELRRLDLLGRKSIDKFIPQEYLFDSIENRIALLQGILDTDGTVQCRRKEYWGTPRFDTISSQ